MPYLTCKKTTCVYPWIWLSSVVLAGECNSKNKHSGLSDAVPISPVQILLYCRPWFPFPFPPPSYPGKMLEPPGAVYLQESIFISHWHVSIHLQGESVEAACSSVGSSTWVTEHYWCAVECGEGAPVSFVSSATVESKNSHPSANEGFVSPASQPLERIVLSSHCENGECGTATCQQPAPPRKSSWWSQCSSLKTSG